MLSLRSEFSPIGGRLSQQRPHRVSFTLIDPAGRRVPSSLTIWSCGGTLAQLLAERQLEAAQLQHAGDFEVELLTPQQALSQPTA